MNIALVLAKININLITEFYENSMHKQNDTTVHLHYAICVCIRFHSYLQRYIKCAASGGELTPKEIRA